MYNYVIVIVVHLPIPDHSIKSSDVLSIITTTMVLSTGMTGECF